MKSEIEPAEGVGRTLVGCISTKVRGWPNWPKEKSTSNKSLPLTTGTIAIKEILSSEKGNIIMPLPKFYMTPRHPMLLP